VTTQVEDLAAVPSGARAVIQGLKGGRQFVQRLTALGFTSGAEVLVKHNYGHGPIITQIRDTRIALGREEARKIQVARVE